MPNASRLALLATALLLGVPASHARAQFGSTVVRTEAVFVDPVLVAPTTYVSPTTYLSPTTYTATSTLIPTAYSSVVPTAYVPTYVESRPARLRRYSRNRPVYTSTRYYDYGLIPTAYYAPTTYVSTASAVAIPTVASYGSICDEPARVSTGRPETEPATPTGKREVNAPEASTRTIPPRVVSVPKNGDPAPADDEANSPPAGDPVPPARAADPGLAPLPADDPPIPGPNDPDAVKNPRIVQRPAFAGSAVLRGEVMRLNVPREGVRVEVISRTRPADFQGLTGVTDADGHFAIRVPAAGTWTVRVSREGGKFLEETFTLDQNGRFNDDKGNFVGLTLNL